MNYDADFHEKLKRDFERADRWMNIYQSVMYIDPILGYVLYRPLYAMQERLRDEALKQLRTYEREHKDELRDYGE